MPSYYDAVALAAMQGIVVKSMPCHVCSMLNKHCANRRFAAAPTPGQAA